MKPENIKPLVWVMGAIFLYLAVCNVAAVERTFEGVYLRHLKSKESYLDSQFRKDDAAFGTNAPTSELNQLGQLAGEIGTIHDKRLELERRWGVVISKEDELELKSQLEAEQQQGTRNAARWTEIERIYYKKCGNLDRQLQDACEHMVLNMYLHSPVAGASQACLAMRNDPDLRKACQQEENSY
jgi:hypothetical protein